MTKSNASSLYVTWRLMPSCYPGERLQGIGISRTEMIVKQQRLQGGDYFSCRERECNHYCKIIGDIDNTHGNDKDRKRGETAT